MNFKRQKGLYKTLIAYICIFALCFAYCVPAGAASKSFKGSLSDEESDTYTMKITKKTKAKLTMTVGDVEYEEDEEYEEESDNFEETDESIEEEDTTEELQDTDSVSVQSVVTVSDGEETPAEEEEEIVDSDEIEEEIAEEAMDDSDEDVSEEDFPGMTLSIKKGSKSVLSKWKIDAGEAASKTVMLTPGTYKISVKCMSDFGTLKYALKTKGASIKTTSSQKNKSSQKKALKVTKKKTLKPGKSFVISVKPISGSLDKITYKSSKKSVAKVNAKGKVTAVKKGTCKIKVKMKGLKKTYTCKIKVK